MKITDAQFQPPAAEVVQPNGVQLDTVDQWGTVDVPPPGTEGTYYQTLDSLEAEYGSRDCTFADVEEIVKSIVGTLPYIDFNAYRAEIDGMTVDIGDNPTTFGLMEALAHIQGYKDRLTTMMNFVDHEYTVRKRVVDMLFDANQAVSKASSADKRKGEATIRYPMLIIRFETINAFRNELTAIINNMRSRGDTISRQVSLIDMQIRLGEYRRKLPDEFSAGEAEDPLDYKSGAPEVNWADVPVPGKRF